MLIYLKKIETGACHLTAYPKGNQYIKGLIPSSFPNAKGKSILGGICQVAACVSQCARRKLPASACEISKSGLFTCVCGISSNICTSTQKAYTRDI